MKTKVCKAFLPHTQADWKHVAAKISFLLLIRQQQNKFPSLKPFQILCKLIENSNGQRLIPGLEENGNPIGQAEPPPTKINTI